MRKLLFLPALLLLAGCAPVLSAVAPKFILAALPAALQYAQGEQATLTDSGTTLTLTNGSTAALEAAVIVLDNAATVTATGADCRPAGAHSTACSIGNVPGTLDGRAYSYVLRYTGMLKGSSAAFYRVASGNRPIFIQSR